MFEGFRRKHTGNPAGVTYVTDDFRISVITGDHFAVERQTLEKKDLYQFDMVQLPNSSALVVASLEKNKDLERVGNLVRKPAVIAQGRPETAKKKLLNRLAKDYIDGQVALGKLQSDQFETFEEVTRRKADREADLERESVTCTSATSAVSRVHSEFLQRRIA